jgi:hypothetical protein
MRTRNDILVATVFCVATGCGRQHGDPGLVAEKRDSAAQKLEMPVVEKRNAAVQKASAPLIIGVTRANLDAKYGMPIRLDITVCNRASQAIWIDESWLPWTFPRSLAVRVESAFLIVELGVGDVAPPAWKKLEPGERLVGHIDLSDWLTVIKRPSTTEHVPVGVGMTLRVSEVDPDQLKDEICDFDFGQLIVEVPTAAGHVDPYRGIVR